MSPIIPARTPTLHLRPRQAAASSSTSIFTATSKQPTTTASFYPIPHSPSPSFSTILIDSPPNSSLGHWVLVGIILGTILTFLLLTGLACCAYIAYLSTPRSYLDSPTTSSSRICHFPRRHHTSCAVSFPTRSYSNGSTSSSDFWRRWRREREHERRRNARWKMKEEFDRQEDFGVGYDNGYRGFWSRGGWPSPRNYRIGMERRDAFGRGRGLNLGVGSPRLGEGLGGGRDALGAGAGIYNREEYEQPLGEQMATREL